MRPPDALDGPPPLPSALDAELEGGSEVRCRVTGALGITALALVMVSPCACGGTFLVGGLLGAGAAFAAVRARNEEPGPAGRVWATAGLWTGGLAAGISLLVLAGLAIVLALQVMGTIEMIQAIQGAI